MYFTISVWLFRLYFTGPYQAAGFDLVYDEPEGDTLAVNFLETTIHMRPKETFTTTAATHYNRRDTLADSDRLYPHRGGATSIRSQRSQVQGYARRVYHNTSSPRVFIDKLVRSHRKHPEYSTREIADAALRVLRGTKRNRYCLSQRHLLHLSQCIQKMQTRYNPQLPFTHFLRPYC